MNPENYSNRSYENIDQQQAIIESMQVLDAIQAATSMQAFNQWLCQSLSVDARAKLLDIGCGLGDSVAKIAEEVLVSGEVTGVDLSEAFIMEAKKRHSQLQQCDFKTADIFNLPFSDNTFDVVKAERVFLHLQDKARALTSMTRVAKQNSTVMIVDVDWHGISVYPYDTIATPAYLKTLCDSVLNPGIGAELLHLFRNNQSLHNIKVDVWPVVTENYQDLIDVFRIQELMRSAVEKNLLTTDSADSYLNALQQASAQGAFVHCVPMYCVRAEKKSA